MRLPGLQFRPPPGELLLGSSALGWRHLGIGPDGRTAVAVERGGQVHLFSLVTGRPVASFAGHPEPRFLAVLSAGVVIGSAEDVVLARGARGERIDRLGLAGMTGVAVSRDSARLAFVAEDGRLRVVRVATGRTVAVGARDDIVAAVGSLEGTHWWVASADGDVLAVDDAGSPVTPAWHLEGGAVSLHLWLGPGGEQVMARTASGELWTAAGRTGAAEPCDGVAVDLATGRRTLWGEGTGSVDGGDPLAATLVAWFPAGTHLLVARPDGSLVLVPL